MSNKATTRREKITRANSTVFVFTAIAAVVVAFCLVSARSLWNKKSYNDRVIEAKTQARDTVKINLENINKLAEQFPALNSSASTNAKTILNALPPEYDYAALASSIESLAQRSGVSFTGAVGQDNSAAAVASAVASSPVEIPLSLQVSGNYDEVTSFIQNLEKSIRPISVTNVVYSGSNTSLRATIQATTYYQPTRSLEVSRRQVE